MFPIEYNNVIFTTITTASYLPMAVVLAQSIKKQMPHSKVIACMVEIQIPSATKTLNTYFDEIILAKNLGFPNFDRFIFQYNQFLGANACKAQLLIYLMETYQNYDKFIFLDSDTKVYSPFHELVELLLTGEIVVSPHFIQFNQADPFYHLGIVHSSGIFNTGLIAVRRGDESRRFLHWWAKLLLKYCYKDPAKGMWNEQKWLDLTPGLFNYCIQKDPGYNVGPWNFHERSLALLNSGKYVVNGFPIRFFHFSGLFSEYFQSRLEKAEPNQRLLIEGIRRDYLRKLEIANLEKWRSKPWSYDYFTSGEPIVKESRSIFKNNSRLFKEIQNPFLKSNQFFKLTLEQHRKKQAPKRKKG